MCKLAEYCSGVLDGRRTGGGEEGGALAVRGGGLQGQGGALHVRGVQAVRGGSVPRPQARGGPPVRAAAGAAASGDLLGLAAPGRLRGWEGAGGGTRRGGGRQGLPALRLALPGGRGARGARGAGARPGGRLVGCQLHHLVKQAAAAAATPHWCRLSTLSKYVGIFLSSLPRPRGGAARVPPRQTSRASPLKK